MIEIERKFLVLPQFDKAFFEKMAVSKNKIQQGYICSDPEKTVRIRTKGQHGYITIKGESSDDGLSRFEWEKEIPIDEALQLLDLCQDGMISKIRYDIPIGKHVFEIDVFLGENLGLIVAEIELKKEKETFEIPEWLGAEVTGQNQYYNASLSQFPFIDW